MLFRLCTVLGSPYIHPDRLAEDLTTAQLDDWVEYAEVQNFGPPADDYRVGQMTWAALVAAGGARTSTPADFIPKWSTEPLSPAEYMERARMVYASRRPKG